MARTLVRRATAVQGRKGNIIMKFIKCESGKLVNADHIVSIEKIYQQGLKRYGAE